GSYQPDRPDSTALLPGNNGSGSIMTPSPRDAHLLARIFAGKDVTDAEIRSMADKTCATFAAVLAQTKGERAQKEAIVQNLLNRAGIDPGPFLISLLQGDPNRPPAAWSPPIEPELPAAGSFPLAVLPGAIMPRFIRTAT